MEIYVVQANDTLYSIAGRFGTSVAELSYSNQIPYPYSLAVGQALYIPVGENPVERRVVSAGGYAYPYISPWVLQETLPYLTSLFVFSYGFTPEGELLPPPVSDEEMLVAAENAGVSAVLTLTPFGADGQFNNNLIHALVTNEEAKNRLMEELVLVVQEKNFQAVDVDFEFILAEDRDRFTAFVLELRQRMNAIGRRVSVALAPKTSADQKGLLYEGKDYRGLGEAADEVLLMTYEWGYAYGPAMAVAPLDKVRQVLEYALTEIPAEKINLGIPNYGYDWTLPFRRGESRAITIGNVQAVQIAIQYGAEIQFDEISQSPYFQYQTNGNQHEVWFEDVRSLQAKYGLLEEYGLKGIGVWQIMRLFRAGWLVLANMYYIE